MKTSIKTSCKRVLLALLCMCGSQVQARNTISWSQFSSPVRANTQIKKSFSRKILTWGGVSLATAVIAYAILTKVRAHKQGPGSSCLEIMKNDWKKFTGLFSKRPTPVAARVNLDDQANTLIAQLAPNSADALNVQAAQALLQNPALSGHKAQELRVALQRVENAHPQEAAQQQNTHNQQTAQKENELSFADLKGYIEGMSLSIYAETDKKRFKDRIATLMQSASESEKAQMTTWLQRLSTPSAAEPKKVIIEQPKEVRFANIDAKNTAGTLTQEDLPEINALIEAFGADSATGKALEAMKPFIA